MTTSTTIEVVIGEHPEIAEMADQEMTDVGTTDIETTDIETIITKMIMMRDL